MAELPYMPMFVDALLADTEHLSNEEFGAYHRLLYAMWRRGGSVPNDAADLWRICHSTPHRWPRLRARLMPFLTKTEDGQLTQKRLANVRLKSKRLVDGNHRKTAKAREAKANKKKFLAGGDSPVTDAYDRRASEAVTSTYPNSEQDRALPIKKAERSILPTDQGPGASSGEPNGKAETAAPVASPGLEGRSLPAPSESPSPALLRSPIVKRSTGSSLAERVGAIKVEDDDGGS